MAESNRDYVEIAKRYARAAIRDKKRKRHCRWIRLASERFIEDLKRARRKECPFLFDRWHATDVCDFIEKLPHVEGKWDSPTIVLHPSQIFFLVQLFGFRHRQPIEIEGYGKFRPRRFTSALLCEARKNAKSTLAAGILGYCECCEPEEGAQVLSAATTFPQASIIFNVWKRMVEKTPDLRDAFGLDVWTKAVSRPSTGSSFKPIHAKASTQDGLNPSHTGLDEIHAHKTPDLLNVLTSASGARMNPLWLYTTTEGYLNPGPWAEIRMFARRLLEGVFGHDADHFLALIFAVDEEDEANGIEADDDFDESAWQKANPLIDTNPYLLAEIRKLAVEAKQMPSKLAEFRIKRLNRQASSPGGWIDLQAWKKCGGEVDLDWLAKFPCWGGMDLASTTDFTAFRLVWKVDGIIYTHGWRWVPESAVASRTERGTVPYAGWVERGLLLETEGNVIDSTEIERTIEDCYRRFDIQTIAYDRWNATDIVTRLVEKNIPMIEFVQGTKSYHPAMQATEKAYIDGKLAHGGDPLLEWCASNLVAKTDQNLSQAPDKKKSGDKIDDMAALFMAVGVMDVAKPRTKSVYEEGVI